MMGGIQSRAAATSPKAMDCRSPPSLRPRRCDARQAPALPQMAILSYAYWQRRFGGRDASISAAPCPARGNNTQIVGVLRPGFELLFPPDANHGAAARYLVGQSPGL